MWVELHRRRRQQPEAAKQASGTECLQQSKQLIRPASTAKHTAPGRMGFVHQHRIPWALDGEETGAAISTRNEMTGDNDDAVFFPGTIGPPYASVNIARSTH